MSFSDRNVLQVGGCASFGEHVVADYRGSGHRCDRDVIIDHWNQKSNQLTNYQGVLLRSGVLGVEFKCQNGECQHP